MQGLPLHMTHYVFFAGYAFTVGEMIEKMEGLQRQVHELKAQNESLTQELDVMKSLVAKQSNKKKVVLRKVIV